MHSNNFGETVQTLQWLRFSVRLRGVPRGEKRLFIGLLSKVAAQPSESPKGRQQDLCYPPTGTCGVYRQEDTKYGVSATKTGQEGHHARSADWPKRQQCYGGLTWR